MTDDSTYRTRAHYLAFVSQNRAKAIKPMSDTDRELLRETGEHLEWALRMLRGASDEKHARLIKDWLDR